MGLDDKELSYWKTFRPGMDSPCIMWEGLYDREGYPSVTIKPHKKNTKKTRQIKQFKRKKGDRFKCILDKYTKGETYRYFINLLDHVENIQC